MQTRLLPKRIEPAGLGFLLITIYLAQALVRAALGHTSAEWQSHEIYRQASGFLLLGFFAAQWKLARMRPVQSVHARIGLVGAPLLMYFHCAGLGFGYQMLLSISFLGTAVLGLMHPRYTRIRNQTYYKLWHLLHVGMACVLFALLPYHLYTVYAY